MVLDLARTALDVVLPAQLLAAVVDPSLITEHANYLRMVFHPLGARRCIVNWDEVARHLLGRAERELGSAKDDQTAVALLTELRSYAGDAMSQQLPAASARATCCCPFTFALTTSSCIFSMIMTLGTPRRHSPGAEDRDIVSADEASERVWRRVAAD